MKFNCVTPRDRPYNRKRGIKSNIPVNPRKLKRKREVDLENLIRIFINRDMLLRDSSVGLKVLKRSFHDMKDWSILTAVLLLCRMCLAHCNRSHDAGFCRGSTRTNCLL